MRVLSKSEVKRYRAIMAEAVRAAKKGKHAEAMAAYDRALAIKPNDPAALTDQGWSAFLLGSLDRAEAITRRALAANGEKTRKAAGTYNLGRILEQRGDKPGAIAAYVESLGWRPSRTVREQLAKLDPAKAAQMDPLRPVPMLGPFAKLEAFCEKKTVCSPPAAKAHVERLVPPYEDVVWFRAGAQCHLAIKLAQGWFVDAKGDDCENNADQSWSAGDLRSTDLVPGGFPEVVFRTNHELYDLTLDDEGAVRHGKTNCDTWMIACGVPAKGTPSCFSMQTNRADGYCGTEDWYWELEPVFTADGMVEVKSTGALDPDARVFLGRRPLAFP
jgi:tetratricopeptide (TPR) repeat protein